VRLTTSFRRHPDIGRPRAAFRRASPQRRRGKAQRTPKYAEARWLLGKVYLDLGDGAGAEKELSRARRLGTTDPELPIALARALLLERKYQEVLDQLSKLPADPPSATVLVPGP
jgi:cytochrome c-type biogenesis protein CcmH/NrfG